MGKGTPNLSETYSIRLRHDQLELLEKLIESMSDERLKRLKDEDRSKFKYPELFKNAGRGSNPKVIMIRLALDDYLKKYQANERTQNNPKLPFFDS